MSQDQYQWASYVTNPSNGMTVKTAQREALNP